MTARPRFLRTYVKVLGIVLAVCVGAPLIVGVIRYVALGSGPYERVGDLCAALDSAQSKALIGTARGTPSRTGDQSFPGFEAPSTERCKWAATATPARADVIASVLLYGRDLFDGGSRARASYQFEIFEFGASNSAIEYSRSYGYQDLTGIGDNAFAAALSTNALADTVNVVALKDNAIVTVTVTFQRGPETNSTNEQPRWRIPDVVPAAPALINDIIEALEPRSG